MHLDVENTQGIRYCIREGWSLRPRLPQTYAESSVDLQLLLSFDDAAIERVFDHFLLFGQQLPDPTGGHTCGLNRNCTTPPYINVPPHLSDQQKSVYLALAEQRLIIEESTPGPEVVEDERPILRTRIRQALAVIIAQEEAEAARHEQLLAQESVGSRAMIYTGAFFSGLWDSGKDFALWLKEVNDVVNPIQRKLRDLRARRRAWLVSRTTGENYFAVYAEERLQAEKREIIEALGFDPSNITREQFDQALDIAELVWDDTALREDIGRFARDYVKAQHAIELTNMSGGAAFEIIFTLALAAVTAGAGLAASAASQTRHITKFRTVGNLLAEFADQQRAQRALRQNRAAQGNAADFSDLPSENASAPQAATTSGSTAPASRNSGTANSEGSADSTSSSDTRSNNSSDTNESSDSNEPDSANDETGQNHNGESSQNNATAVEGGEPINLKTGEERLTLVDAVLDGPLPFTLARTYRSSNPKDFGLGHGWTHTLGEKLIWRGKGKALHFYDAEGRVIALPAPGESGRSHNVVEKLSLTRINDDHWVIAPYGAPNGVQKHFKPADAYADHFALAEIRDGYGNFHRFHYVDNRLICLESSLGEALHISPAKNGGGRIGTLKKETRDGQISTIASYQYSDDGDLISATDADGHSEQYRYHRHVIAQRTLKSGYNFYFEWDAEGPAARCVRQWGDPIDGQPTYSYQFQWDDNGRGVTVTDTRGGRERYRFNERALPIYHRDAEGAETLYEYNTLGQLTRLQLPAEEGLPREERYEYDQFGRLAAKIDASGGRHRIEYNDEGLPAKITDPAGHSWQRRYNKQGQIAESIDPLGNATKYSYNPIGLVGAVTDPLGNSTRYLWNPQGKLSAVHDPMGRSRHYRYDNAQRLVEIQQGQRSKDAPGASTRYEYDRQDRISAVITPDGGRTEYRYNAHGLISEIIDAAGRSTRYDYDGLSQVRMRTNPDGSRLEYHYDGERNLVGLTNEKGERYQLKYDLAERLIEEVGFDGRTTRYAYNRAGHLIASRAVTDTNSGAGLDTAFERDAFGRLLRETTPDGVTSFHYNRAGQLTQAENEQRKLRWQYDACGRVIADWQDQHKISHRYDAAGNRIASTLPDGEELHFAYNPAGQFESLHHRPAGAEAAQLLTAIDRDEQGRETERQHGNGLTGERDYDPQGRLRKLSVKAAGPVENPENDPVQKPLIERGYHYNPAGQIAQIDDSLRGSRHYHYDALDRLTQVDGPQPEHFVHDPAHNILAAADSPEGAQQQASETRVSGNRLAFRGDIHYRYDAHGNRIAALRGKGQKLQTRYHYNSRQQLIRVEQLKVDDSGEEKQQRETRYQYDPLGRRIAKIDGEKQIAFLWDGDVLLRETTYDAETHQDLKTRSYYFEPGTFQPLALSENGETYHYHLDHLGTPDTLTDSQGEIAWSVSYQTYGNVAIKHCNRIEQPIRFQGQYFDEESGLHYNRFRYYDPVIGEFTTQDPIRLLGGKNNYNYVKNPIAWIDPLGLAQIFDVGTYSSLNGAGNVGDGLQAHELIRHEFLVQEGLTTKDVRMTNNPSIALDLDHHTRGPLKDSRGIGGVHYHERQVRESLGLGKNEFASTVEEELDITTEAMRRAGIPESKITQLRTDSRAFYNEEIRKRNSQNGNRDCS
ncbi:RHS repeat-associated core domain-containing protein [Microbulbifer celer]|uniref:RHS repeat-associated core domain-containing protein n=1 Tax=Microbulbifer celer TaxID=435905 RepID=A0ABW3U4Q0_9GAMM|nr:RHS repeat-associated core domain-containing protein [Microbulbifer celer]UFN56756.1 DUF6531 domain-containing protein [Microbulbifer celer]